MRWTERQRAMLREMGVRVWSREPAATAAGAVGDGGRRGAAVAARSCRRAARSAQRRADAHRGARSRAPASAAKLAAPTGSSSASRSTRGDRQQEQLLDNMLRAIGVARAAPARARRATYLAVREPASSGRSSTPSGDAALAAAIEVVAPRCILALGRAAAAARCSAATRRSETGAAAATRTRRCRSSSPSRPPYLLRHPADKAKAWADLCRAVGGAGAAPGATAGRRCASLLSPWSAASSPAGSPDAPARR